MVNNASENLKCSGLGLIKIKIKSVAYSSQGSQTGQ